MLKAFLVFLFLLCCPSFALAADMPTASVFPPYAFHDPAYPITNFDVGLPPGREALDKRDMNSKTVYKGNGVYVWTGSTEPVHYEDEQNQWQEVDTTLQRSSLEGYDVENVTNNYKTYFKRDITKSAAVRYQMGDSVMIIEAVDHTWGKLQKTRGRHAKSQFVYPESYKGVDIRYTISAQWLFEEYVVKTRERVRDIDAISQRIMLQNAVLDEQPDGSVWFRNVKTNEVLWKFPKPFMFEDKAKDVKNYDLHYVIVKEAEDIYLLTKFIDPKGRAWLLADDRHYPVVIDDTATLNDPAEDGYVYWDDDFSEWGEQTTLTTLMIRYGPQMGRAYIEWSIASISNSASITQVVFKYHGQQNTLSSGAKIVALSSHRPTSRTIQELYADIGSASIYVNPWTIVVAIEQSQDLGASAVTNLQTQLANDWYAIGMLADVAVAGYIYSEEYGSANPKPTLEVTYSVGSPAPFIKAHIGSGRIGAGRL